MKDRSRFTWVLLLLIAVGLDVAAWRLLRGFRVEPLDVHVMKPRLQANSRGEKVAIFGAVGVVDSKTNEFLWSAPLPAYFPVLVGDHYLVGATDGRIEAVDIDDALAAPFIEGTKRRDVQFEKFGIAVDEFPTSGSQSPTIFRLPGTNRFLAQSTPLILKKSVPLSATSLAMTSSFLGTTVCACEIDSRSIRVLARWTCAPKGLFVLPNGEIVSQDYEQKQFEVRNPTDFRIERSYPVPAGIAGLIHRNYLLGDAASGKIYRLDDLSLVPELTIPLCPNIEPENGDDQRCHILSDGFLDASKRLAVYDAIDRRIVFDSGPARGFFAALIKDGKLRLTKRLLGYTTDVIDLRSGEVVAIERPLLRNILGMIGVLVAALVWLIAWLTYVRVKPVLVGLNIAFVSMLFLAPMVMRYGGRNPYWYFEATPVNQYTLGITLTIFFAFAMFTAFGPGRSLPRLAIYLGALSALIIFIDGFRIISFHRTTAMPYATLSLRVLLTFCMAAVCVLWGMRHLGFRVSQPNRPDLAAASSSKTHLLDYFYLTASIAVASKAFAPHIELILDPSSRWYIFGRSILLVGCGLVGMLALIDSDRIQRLLNRLAIAVALLAISAVVATVCLEMYYRDAWYQMVADTRDPTFVMLGSFTFCRMIQQSGYFWSTAM